MVHSRSAAVSETRRGLDLGTENDEALRIRVRGRPSPYRAHKTEIVSTPRDGSTYHHGEHIDVALTFNTAGYVPPSGSVIAIRVGDSADGSNCRAAEYLSGSQTNRLVYRYQVQLADADEDGISVDVGGPNSGFGGTVPTIVASFGLLPVIDYYPGLADDHHHRVDGSLHVHDVAITSIPAHEDGYRVGEDIDVTLTFSTEAYATGDSVIAIRVGDDGPSYRRAGYVSGSGTTRLTYRYQVQLTDFDADGISIPSSGFVRELPTTSPALGSVPVSRDYSGVDEDAGHTVDGHSASPAWRSPPAPRRETPTAPGRTSRSRCPSAPRHTPRAPSSPSASAKVPTMAPTTGRRATCPAPGPTG